MSDQSWIKLPAISGQTACLTCGCGSHDTLSMDSLLAVGFGDASVTKNGIAIYSENLANSQDEFWQCKDAEAKALQDPENDWRIHFHAPLYEAHYQRHGPGHWVLIEKGDGFA
jgi:hypothetical protein